jgi:Phage integrase, N-terminal SAM-like domain
MARKVSGSVLPPHIGRDGRAYRALRFTAYGKRRYVSLGPVSEAEAQRELRYVLADVERGVWQPHRDAEAPAEPEPVPTFHEFAEQWWVRQKRQLAPNTCVDYEWRLRHLLPTFGNYRLDQITLITGSTRSRSRPSSSTSTRSSPRPSRCRPAPST